MNDGNQPNQQNQTTNKETVTSKKTTPVTSTPPKQEATLSKQTPKKGGNFKYFLTVVLFLGLFAIVFFLPEISDEVKMFMQRKETKNIPTVTISPNGLMSCTLSKTTGARKVTSVMNFQYIDKKLKETNRETTTLLDEDSTGDDLTALETSLASCELLEKETKEIEGMTTSCKRSGLSLVVNETVDYQKFKLEAIEENIAELEGNIPEFQLDQDIEELKSIMQASGYTCEFQ